MIAIAFGSIIYGVVEPRRFVTKIIVAIGSLFYGLFVVFILGGPIGGMIPVFLDPIGFVIQLVIIFVVGIVFTLILSVVAALLDQK